jgi:VWFA-related protein
MKIAFGYARLLVIPTFAVLLFLGGVAQAQTPSATPPPVGDDDVIRVNSELVQSDIMVFDKKGHFVDGLKAEQFLLKIDGQTRPIPFFERVAASNVLDTSGGQSGVTGSATSGATSTGGTTSTGEIGTRTGRGRTIIFFVDDLHLSPDSITRTRTSLLTFLDSGMLPNDQVAITSTSGQIGFLQQFTDDKVILREAIAKLTHRPGIVHDSDEPPMSEYLAAQVNNGDKATIDFFVAKLLQQNSAKINGQIIHFVDPMSAENMVKNRAREIGQQTGAGTDNTLKTLEGLMRTAAQLPGRKLVFMVSDGFFLTDRRYGSPERVRRVTDAANRAGVVIYTVDARGLVNTGTDASAPFMDVTGMLELSNVGELSASQDGLNALARDTGGIPFRGTNVPMAELVKKVLVETSVYYLLAWQPQGEEEKSRRFKKIEVSVIGHPEWTVRVRNGYYMTVPLRLNNIAKKEKDPVKARETAIRVMIDSVLPQQEIPTKVGVRVVPVLANSSRLTATIQIDRNAVTFLGEPPSTGADMDIGAIFYDQKGKPVDSFVGKIRVLPLTPDASERERQGMIYTYDTWLAPGLYQVRVAVRDTASGRVGSAMQWVQVAKL